MLRNLVVFLMLVTFTGCGGGYYRGGYRKKIDTEEVSRIILVYSEKLYWEKHLRLEDSVVFYEDTINAIRLDYSSEVNIELWDARKILVDAVEDFLERINSNTSLFPLLTNTPMTANDLEVYITFPSFYNKYVDLQTIGLITLRGGVANYFASDAIDCDTWCWHRRSEYYTQSKSFVQSKREGELLYKPKEIPPQERTAFDEIRYFSPNVEY